MSFLRVDIDKDSERVRRILDEVLQFECLMDYNSHNVVVWPVVTFNEYYMDAEVRQATELESVLLDCDAILIIPAAIESRFDDWKLKQVICLALLSMGPAFVGDAACILPNRNAVTPVSLAMIEYFGPDNIVSGKLMEKISKLPDPVLEDPKTFRPLQDLT